MRLIDVILFNLLYKLTLAVSYFDLTYFCVKECALFSSWADGV